jgi:hypothetical protein
MRKKLENMTVKEIEKELASNGDKQTELYKEMAPIESKLSRLHSRSKKLEEQIDKIRISRKKTDWAWILSESGHDGMEKYRHREQKLREIGLRSSGYLREIQQVCVQVMLTKNDDGTSLSATMKGLKKILKYIKPFQGYKYLDIFEHTLSEGGVWNLLIDEEKNEYKIQVTIYGREETRHTFDNLKDALKKIQETYYYEDLKKEEYAF